MAQLNLSKTLGAEGTISFRLNPVVNSTDRLYLLDFGEEQNKNRITLVVIKNSSQTRHLSLEIFNDNSKKLEKSEPFPDFKIGLAFDVELVWSTAQNKIAVFVNDNQFIELSDKDVKFSNLGNIIHYGEDIAGQNKTEIEMTV